MRDLTVLRRTALAAHATLMACIVATVAPASWPRAGVALALVVPLLLALPGLVRAQRYTYQWLAVVLVLYSGGASIEVVAAPEQRFAAALALLAALGELALLLVLIRAYQTLKPRG